VAEGSIADYVGAWATSPFATVTSAAWFAVRDIEALVREALRTTGADYVHEGEFAVHRMSIIEGGAILKGPGIIGPNCFVAAGAYLRGGTYLGEGCIVGPNSELKSSFMFAGSKIAHLNFVGDSIIGSGVNIEAGAIVANYRNELDDKQIRIRLGDAVIDTGVDKFGALIGDGARIGANAVVAPGALIAPGRKIGRLQVLDQYPY
jgi:NDP-sugar pyrophosphorylase family protein